MLAFQYRFHGHGSLQYVYKRGEAQRSRLMTVKTTRNKRRDMSRFAVGVSKKVHKSAVGRNRIRRRLYEVVRAELPAIKEPHDVVIIVTSSEILAQPYAELHKQVKTLFSAAGLYKTDV